MGTISRIFKRQRSESLRGALRPKSCDCSTLLRFGSAESWMWAAALGF